MDRIYLKEQAKASLDNQLFGSKWLMAVLACLIFGALEGGVSQIIPGVGAMIIMGPMLFGLTYLFLKQSRDNAPMQLGDLFKGFTEDFVGNFLLGLLMNIFVALWSLLFVIPGIVKSYAYSQAFYIKADHPGYDWRACLSASQAMMQGHKMELFILDLSFIGWYFVGSLCLGVGTLWVAAYHQATRAQFYKALCGTAWIEG